MSPSSDVFLFGEFRLDCSRGGLFRRDDHGAFAPVATGARALDLLAVLIERQGNVVPKQEIMAAVWPRMAVEEGNLFVQIAALRAILDDRSGQSCIRTVTGRGYRFIMPATRCAGGVDFQERFPLSSDGTKPTVPLAMARSPEPQPSPSASAERTPKSADPSPAMEQRGSVPGEDASLSSSPRPISPRLPSYRSKT